ATRVRRPREWMRVSSRPTIRIGSVPVVPSQTTLHPLQEQHDPDEHEAREQLEPAAEARGPAERGGDPDHRGAGEARDAPRGAVEDDPGAQEPDPGDDALDHAAHSLRIDAVPVDEEYHEKGRSQGDE